jgi:RNA methyltransferase, TrmH family
MAPGPDGAASDLIGRYRRARHDPTRAVLEGFHAVKHAIRFHADIEHACTADPDDLGVFAERLAPDVAPQLRALLTPVPAAVLEALAPAPIETGVIAIARRPRVDAQRALEVPGTAPVVLLEAPAHLGNLGAVVRVAAAAGAAAVLTTGAHDPWHPAALRGSAGLHFALPVARIETAPPPSACPLWAIDPAGEPVRPGTIPGGVLLAFGSERRGLSEALRTAAERRIAIPMRAGVSSLNLASAVAVILYLWQLGEIRGPARLRHVNQITGGRDPFR